ncbi:MAG: nitroreductase family deazaflavin-dependent oxidoreductase [Deltaproteobacteria bacterium]|nr:nitroreductase family deazaflavin-dependent oxidoreductase [Deltaproteobacteria bacterium]
MTTTPKSPSPSGSPPPRWVLKAMTRLHVFLHRVSGGGLNKLGGDEVCFVTMTGAKSGRTLTIPLMYVPHGDGVLLVASQGGAPRNPVWYHNLVAHPDIQVEHRGDRMELRARLAGGDEKPALWPVCDRHYAPYAEYRTRTTRDIPVFVCEPR